MVHLTVLFVVEIVHMDTRMQILVAVRCGNFGCAGYPHHCGASARVSLTAIDFFRSVATSLSSPLDRVHLTNYSRRKYRKDKFQWECDNDHAIWPDNVNYTTYSMPKGFCHVGFSGVDTAWIIAVLIDLVFQVDFSLSSLWPEF